MKDLTNDDKKEINSYLDEFEIITSDTSDTEVQMYRLQSYLARWADYKFTPQLLGRIFLLVNPPDSDGFSAEITINELTNYHPSFKTSNGGDWCRSHNSYLGHTYIIRRTKQRGRIYSIKLDGLNKGLTINQGIRKDIVETISKQRCVILDVGRVEVDHKNGKKDEYYMNELSEQSISDFQPLSKAANDAKREHCKKCKATGKRYDAKRLGYSESFTKGDFDTDNCQGCYWYDPKKFNEEISKSYEKIR